MLAMGAALNVLSLSASFSYFQNPVRRAELLDKSINRYSFNDGGTNFFSPLILSLSSSLDSLNYK